ncbi:histone-lysine N-methyltransferase, H3 lysine-79 specific-like [Solenopsis invicta]|uniref:histone-lysine N-methyltransferase, H3 lysine-79 specific-like n=1 Tax=Solenopsis invicta TaxID=13686 RepID=UPI0005958785|nr:histone-lysine N-methyltransferase, H3 lysine-79 specific-like [Solenopsis invicta]
MREWMEDIRKKVDNLERRVEDIEKDGGRVEKGGREKNKREEIQQIQIRGKGEMKEQEERMRRLELGREKRKKNIIIKRVRVKKERKEELQRETEKVVEATGAVARVERVRRIGNNDKGGEIIVWVKFASVREKIDVIKGKTKLRDRNEWIVDDLTEKERKVEWWIKREAEKNRRKEKK